MRVGALTLLALPMATSAAAFADPVEGSAFTGVTYLREPSGLGDSSTASDDKTALQGGGRITLFPWRTAPTEVGGELELSYAQLGSTPVVAYRGLVLVRLADGKVRPHIGVGAGAATVITSSATTRRDTDFALVSSFGVTIPVSTLLHLRADVRQNWMESFEGGWAAMYEFQVGLGGTFAPAKTKRRTTRPRPTEVLPPPVTAQVVVVPKPAPTPPDPDSDGDGIPNRNDQCPGEREDVDLHEDADGCPDLDDDGDGIADAKDKCPLKAETMNGIADDDGCPDELPAKYVVAFTAAAQVTFDNNGARLSEAAKANLDKVAALLVSTPKLRVTMTVHPEANSEDAKALAVKRANAVKWYLTDQGVAERQLETNVGAPATGAPVLEVTLAANPRS